MRIGLILAALGVVLVATAREARGQAPQPTTATPPQPEDQLYWPYTDQAYAAPGSLAPVPEPSPQTAPPFRPYNSRTPFQPVPQPPQPIPSPVYGPPRPGATGNGPLSPESLMATPELADAHPVFEGVDTGGYDLWTDSKLDQLDPDWQPVFRSMIRRLIQHTNLLNTMTGSDWNWRVNNTRRSGSTGYHPTGKAVDLNLYAGTTGQTIQPRGSTGPQAVHWWPLTMYHIALKEHDLRWGGLFWYSGGRRHWDPVHGDAGSYSRRSRAVSDWEWWMSLRPEGS